MKRERWYLPVNGRETCCTTVFCTKAAIETTRIAPESFLYKLKHDSTVSDIEAASIVGGCS